MRTDCREFISLINWAATEVTEYTKRQFATVNVKYFVGLGFERVWNPLEP